MPNDFQHCPEQARANRQFALRPTAKRIPAVLDDRAYYAVRAAEERVIAMASGDLRVRSVHLEMAARYDALVRGAVPRRTWIVGGPQPDAATEVLPAGDATNVAAVAAKVTRMSGRTGR